MTQITASFVADRLADQVEAFTRDLLPNGKRDGNDYCVGSVGGEEGKSLKIHLTGEHAGQWRDWADDSQRGDLLDLLAKVKGCDISTAIDQACSYLNLPRTRMESAQTKSYKKPEPPEGRRAVAAAQDVDMFFASRGISQETLAAFKIIASGKDAAVFPFFRGEEVVHIQYRSVRKKEFWASEGTEMILFGWQAVPPMAREVIITEGPMDALAWYEYGYAALSVPQGAGTNGKNAWIERQFKEMERFDKIYICMDKDEPGKAATQDIVERLGRHRCFVIHLPDPHKDANDCLMAKVPPEIIDQAVKGASTMDPGELRNASFFADAVVEHFNPNKKRIAGFNLPWSLVAGELTLGYGQTTMLAGWNGSGKSTIVGQITLDAIRQGGRACVASLEFKAHTYIAWLVRQALCKPDPSPEEVRAAVAQISDNLWAFSAYGSAKLDKILDVWEYAHSRYGTKLFILDNFSKLNLGVGGKDDNNVAQSSAITKITEFAVNNNAHVIVLAHSRKKLNENEEVGKLDIKGAGTLTDLVDIVLLIHRNKKKERAMLDRGLFAALPIEEQVNLQQQPDAFLTCDKNRHGEVEPRLRLWFDRQSHQYTESGRGMPVRYVKT